MQRKGPKRDHNRKGSCLLCAVTLTLAACGPKPSSPVISSSAPPQRAPLPPSGAIPDFRLPAGDGKGGFKTANSAISASEAVWHVRSALNVAALACGDRAIVANYNAMLKRQKSAFAAAYESETRQFEAAAGSGWRSAMDGHMTRLYNFFAQPPVQRGFCAVAARVATEAQSMSDVEFQRFAAGAIDRLDRPFQDFYRAYQAYQRELAAWRASGGQPTELAAARSASVRRQAVGNMASWWVQLGAFSGSDAARSAWTEVRRRAPGLASFAPHYEAASVKGLVRLQVGPVTDRAEALKLCAAAAVAALDCLPVSPAG